MTTTAMQMIAQARSQVDIVTPEAAAEELTSGAGRRRRCP